MTTRKPQLFDAVKVRLAGSNLIEASAGTGKTYSIAILALRLVIEKGFGVEQILMVTFTKSAVAELEERIRAFIREAYKCTLGNEIDDKTIRSIVEEAIKTEKDNPNKDKFELGKGAIEKRLKTAILFLDELAVFTIHSFCQKTLTEFAFETGQIFGNELINNQDDLLNKAVNEYWRTRVTSLEIDLLAVLDQLGLSREGIAGVTQQTLGGKQFVAQLKINPNENKGEREELIKNVEEAEERLTIYHEVNKEELVEITNSGKILITAFGEAVNQADTFIEAFRGKYTQTKRPGYLMKKFPDFNALFEALEVQQEALTNYYKGIINWIYEDAIKIVVEQVQSIKKHKNVLTFDDLINNLHTAITGVENEELIRGLQWKYRAVFIDEFQDTDKLQFDIFHTAFGERTVLFYIGDPKQAIYAFRKADINTYKIAKKGVKNIFTMAKNYRSTKDYVDAMNLFFEPTATFDAFADNEIRYEKVSQGKDVGQLTVNNEKVFPITITQNSTKGAIYSSVANEIYHVLTTHCINGKKVEPSDIGVLVRTKGDGADIKEALALLNIPAVTIDDTKVMLSEEAVVVFNVLEASLEPNRGSINKALLTPVVGKTVADILVIDEEKSLENFYGFQEVWRRSGVYSTLLKFITRYQIKSHLLDGRHANGERMITNIYQIMEILHKYETTKNASPEEVLSWMSQFFDGKESDGDEFTQRIESDNQAVNIVTIHKSKGLAYPIVFAPFLDMSASFNVKRDLIEYRDHEMDDYVFSPDKSEEQKLIYQLQNEEENRRLLYVALTRAIYKCFITNNTRVKTSALKPFLTELAGVDTIEFIEYLELREEATDKYEYQKEEIQRIARSTDAIGEINDSWRVLSYSRLNTHHAVLTKREPKNDFSSAYEEFIFKLLPKGSITGEFLHHLFEFSDYTNNKHWERVIIKAGKRYSKSYKEEFIKEYLRHIQEVVTCKLEDESGKSFQLKEISRQQKLAEMEFYFKIDQFNTSKLDQLSDLYQLGSNHDYTGMMTGFIDLFFEHEGKYYILDWKSNHLGSEVANYDKEGTSQAMLDNNYNLQYLIYTVAVKRYLKNRIPDFDYKKHFGGVFYLFLRGVRANENSGVFYSLPDENLINAMDKVLR